MSLSGSLVKPLILVISLEDYVNVPYSRKYWRALNLAVGPQIAIRRILADLNLAVRYGIAIRIYASRKFWRILIWRLQYRPPNRQTAKFNSPPNFPAIRYHIAGNIGGHLIGRFGSEPGV